MSGVEQNEVDELRQLAHDLKNCLHAIGIAAKILPEIRHEDAQFTEVCDSISNDSKEAVRLIRELVETVARVNPSGQADHEA